MKTKTAGPRLAVRLYDAHGNGLFGLATVLLCDREAAGLVVAEVLAAGVRETAPGREVTAGELAGRVLTSCCRLLGDPSGSTPPGPSPTEPVLAGLARLSYRQRAALGLVVFAGSDLAGTADLLGIPSAGAVAALHEALARLVAGEA